MTDHLCCSGGLDHLPEIQDIQKELYELYESGYDVLTPADLDYHEERSGGVKATASDVQTRTFPLPDLDTLSQEDRAVAEEWKDEALRSVVMMPRSERQKLVEAVYPEMMGAQAKMVAAASSMPPIRWDGPAKNYTEYHHTPDNTYYVVEHTGEGSFNAVHSTLKYGGVSSHTVIPSDPSWTGGKIPVLVDTDDVAWTNANWPYNQKSGSNNERDGYAGSTRYSEAHYQMTARWDLFVMRLYKIPLQLGCRPGVKGSAYRAGLLTHRSIPYPSTHVDPEPALQMDKLMSYIIRLSKGDAPTPPKPPAPKPPTTGPNYRTIVDSTKDPKQADKNKALAVSRGYKDAWTLKS